MIRLVLADDQPIVLEGLRHLFGGADFRVLACVTDREDALVAVRQCNPDVLVLDLAISGRSGLDLLRDLRREGLPTKVVVLTALDGDQVLDAISLGANGVVLKGMAVELIVRCVREVSAGHNWLERSVASRAVQRFVRSDTIARSMSSVLTPREREVASLVAEGLASKTIAKRLAINEGTVKLHLHKVYRKLNVRGRVALMQFMRSAAN